MEEEIIEEVCLGVVWSLDLGISTKSSDRSRFLLDPVVRLPRMTVETQKRRQEALVAQLTHKGPNFIEFSRPYCLPLHDGIPTVPVS